MKVLHVVHNSHPDLTGGAIRTRYLVETQARMGVQPVVLSAPFQPPLDPGQGHGVEWLGGVPYYRSYNGTDPARFMAANKPWWERAAKMGALVSFVRRICRVAREERVDLIHAHSLFFCGLAAIAAGRRLGLPVVYEVRSLIEDGLESGGRLAPFAHRLFQRAACRLASRVVVISEGLREEMVRCGVAASKITVAGNGVDLEAHRPPPERRRETRGPFALGYIGTLVSYEGLDLLIDAVALLAAAHPELRLRIVGDGPVRSALEEQTQRLGLEAAVCFLGRVEHGDIAAQYEAIDLFVLPRRPSRLTDAVTPLKPLEIMAHAKPLLAGDCGGHRELIVDGVSGALFHAAGAGALARCIEQMMADREGLARLGRQAREWVCRNRSWETQCGPVIELYEKLLEGRRTGGILLVAPKPRAAPTGGVETGVALILRSPVLQKHGIAVWDRGRLRCGGFRLARAARQLLHFARFAAYLAAHRPRAVRIKTSSGVNFFQSAIYAWISRRLGCRAVMELHSGEFEGWYESRSVIGRWVIRLALRCPSELVALSEYWRNMLARVAPGRPIQVVPNGVEIPELLERRPHSGALRVLTIATLGAYKGHFDILAAAAQLRDRPIRFLLAGPDETDGRGEGGLIRRWADVLDLNNTVRFAGPVGPQEKWKLLFEADVFLLPSRAEGMPNAVLEAMAAGLPVVATPVGALPEMLGEGLGARFVPVGDSEALTEALLELLADPAWREKMGQWNRARVEARYSMRRVEQLLDALYAGRLAGAILPAETIERTPEILAAGSASK
ncbi:MAG TPA: glycosyltransferase [Bryobacterales bacterium]|nr:glycosyltransferase [Bryobacterales bacterium]